MSINFNLLQDRLQQLAAGVLNEFQPNTFEHGTPIKINDDNCDRVKPIRETTDDGRPDTVRRGHVRVSVPV